MWDLEWGGGHQKWVVFLPRIDGSFLCHFPEYNNIKILRNPERNWFETNSNSILNFLKLTFLLINVKKNVYLSVLSLFLLFISLLFFAGLLFCTLFLLHYSSVFLSSVVFIFFFFSASTSVFPKTSLCFPLT